ncbi:hypothetical protein LIER_12453 [Lithospermum erythrorhizon]|uniref:BHLH domain-containing protein n=1 Tax=Lithospermum erythrorhizon TaxID=34254 RepID=A0AAV3PRT9_LITER
MDPPILNDASFSAANPAAYSLAGIWPFGGGGGDMGGLGLRIGGFGNFGDGSTMILNRDLSVDESTVTEQSGSRGGVGVGLGRKRKDGVLENECSKLVSTSSDNDLNDLNGKRMKGSGPKDDSSGGNDGVESSSKTENKASEQDNKAEPPKDYIHVRARRGQATDSHSLAERARREKISERMKILQDLVPGCNKVIGKALVLDEIINYVQSLQHQVEFLSMKLEAVNSRMNPNIEGFPPKELTTQAFDATGMMFGSQPLREYVQGSQTEWLQMQLGGSYERAG